MSFYVIDRPSGTRPAPTPSLTQGAIVEHLRIPRYSGRAHHGLLITARCDLEHIRSDSLNFLPIIPVKHWLRFDGALSILLSEIDKRRQTAQRLIRQLDPNLERVIDLDDWESSLQRFAEGRADLNKGVLAELKGTLALYTALRGEYFKCATDCDATEKAVLEPGPLSALYNRLSRQKIDELLSDKVFDGHFVPTIDMLETTDTSAGYVILFRHIISVPGIIAPYLVPGVWSEAIQSNPELRGKLEMFFDLSPKQFIALISNVSSPHLEYIVQRFVQVFARIGSPDFTPEYRQQIRGACEG